jgi:hypothetical protein
MAGPLESGFRQYLTESNRRSLDAFIEKAGSQNFAAPEEAVETPQESKKQEKGVLATGVETTVETGKAGYQHFVNGLYRSVGNNVKDWNKVGHTELAGEVLSGMGESILGGLSFLAALPMGIGDSIRRAIEVYTPGGEGSIAVPGNVAFGIHSVLSIPMLLDPKFREALGDPKRREMLSEEFSKPMTYAELFGLIGTFYPGIKAQHVLQRRIGRIVDPSISEPKLGTAFAEGVAESAPRPSIVNEPLLLQQRLALPPRQNRVPPGGHSDPAMTPEAIAARLQVISEELRGGGAKASKEAPGDKPSPAESSSQAKPVERTKTDADVESYYKELGNDFEKAVKTAEETFREIVEELNVEERKIFGPVKEKPTSATKAPRQGGLGGARSGAAGEAGFVGMDALSVAARAAVGAAIGGTQGDTPEERIAYAMAGLGLGVFGPRMAKTLVEKLRSTSPRILDESNPVIPGYKPPPPQPSVKKPTSGNMTVENILNRDPLFEPYTNAEFRQARHIETQAVQQVFDIAKKMKRGESIVPGELKEAMAIARSVGVAIGEASEGGRRAAGRGIESRVADSQRELTRLAREWDPATPESTLANLITGLKRNQQISLFTRLYYAVPEALSQAMYGAILSGEALVKNGLGTSAMMPISAIDRSIASMKFWEPNRPMIGEAPRAFISIWEAVTDQIRLIRHADDYKQAWRLLDEQAERMGATHAEVTARGFEALSDMSHESSLPMIGRGLQWLANAANAGPGVLVRTDGMSKYIFRKMAANWEAMEYIAQTEGRTGKYWSRVGEVSNDYSQLPLERLQRVKDFADHMTFTQQFEGRLMQALQQGPADPWANLAYRMTVGTFVRTPIRLLEVGAEYTPGLNALARSFHKEMSAGGTQRAVAEARLASGLLVIGSFMYAAMNGLITGSPPTDPKEIRALEAAGLPPRSFWDPLSQKYRSYAGMEPLTTLIATGANLAKVVPKLKEPDAVRLVLAATLAEVEAIDSNIYLQAVSEVLDVLKNGRDDVRYGKSLEYVRRRLAMFNPAILREIEQGGDPARRRVIADQQFDKDKTIWSTARQEFDMLLQEYKRGFPGMSEDIKIERNMFTGEPMLDDVWPFNPFRTRPEQPAEWAKEIRRLHEIGIGSGIDRLDEWIGQHREYDIGMTQRPELPGVRLTARELDRWEVLMTQEVTNAAGQKLTGALDAMVTSAQYRRQSDVTKKDMLHRVWLEFKLKAQTRLFNEEPELRRAVEGQRRGSMLERLPVDHPLRQNRRITIQP